MPLSLPELALLWATAVATAVITAYLAKRTAEGEGIMGYGYNFFLLTVLVGMPAAALGYLYQPGYIGAFWAVWINMAFMTVGLIPLMYGFMIGLTDYSGKSKYATTKLGRKAAYRWSAVALILSNEFMMGWVFLLLSGKSIPLYSVSPFELAEEFAGIISSSWFVFTMAIEMVVAIYLFRKRFQLFPLVLLLLQSLIMALTPTALQSQAWYHWSVIFGNLTMTLLFIIAFYHMHSGHLTDPSLKKYLSILFLIYSVMMLGLYIWAIEGDTIIVSVAIIAEMSLYFGVIIREENFSNEVAKEPFSVSTSVILTGSILLSQLFMGGVIVIEELGINPSAQGVELLMNSRLFDALFALLAVSFSLFALAYNLKQLSSSGFDSTLSSRASPFLMSGLLLFPFAVLVLDELADSNPSFHMLQHLLIGVGGFLSGISADFMLNTDRANRTVAPLVKLRDFIHKHAFATLLFAIFIFAVWLEPRLFIFAYQDETVHGLEHFTILAAGLLSGAVYYHLKPDMRFLLLNVFLWMGPMMLPFSLLLGPYSFEPVYFTYVMSEMMGIWVTSMLFIIAMKHLSGREIEKKARVTRLTKSTTQG
ncbi:MAG: cytochrome c oxidase assembly protein [Conexivisphaerales archaeon]